MIAPLTPAWPAPPGICAYVTTRHGGTSVGPYASLNLATHVGDDPAAVAANRVRLIQALALPSPPRWLTQIHGPHGIDAALPTATPPVADAAWTCARGVVCAVLTADCLPILLCDMAGTAVAAIHAGWRGLVAGVIANTCENFPAAGPLLAWIGPGIAPPAYRVGADLRARFLALDGAHAGAFHYTHGAWHADLAHLADHQLRRAGVTEVYTYAGGTGHQPADFPSFRRDGVCGRFASLIWIR
ncbi:MAG: peptidoglycan editing factor PgeF [Gammaproteobacteria bacterium]|nr:peptidoglycan editing factor PgeF [Gammaproteobacteria bacterium]